jgi:hypothetical protein
LLSLASRVRMARKVQKLRSFFYKREKEVLHFEVWSKRRGRRLEFVCIILLLLIFYEKKTLYFWDFYTCCQECRTHHSNYRSYIKCNFLPK